MPVHRHTEADPLENRQELFEQLLAEWQHEGGGSGAPEIDIVEGGRVFGLVGKPLRLTVTWDRWEGVEMQDRSSVIMDVFQKVADHPEDILRVTAVMGLTPAEAEAKQIS